MWSALILAAAPSLAPACFTEHVVDALVVNARALPAHAAATDGRSLPASLALLAGEVAMLPAALALDAWAAASIGDAGLCAAFVPVVPVVVDEPRGCMALHLEESRARLDHVDDGRAVWGALRALHDLGDGLARGLDALAAPLHDEGVAVACDALPPIPPAPRR